MSTDPEILSRLHDCSEHEAFRTAIQASDLPLARSIVHRWLHSYLATARNASRSGFMPTHADGVVDVNLFAALADVVEATSDPWLIESLWQGLESILRAPSLAASSAAIPLVGVPIINRVDLLQTLLDSIDYPVDTLALVDNSGSASAFLSAELDRLARTSHPLITSIRISRPFCNLGVAASWNQILRSFPSASFSLLVNNDVVFAPGALQRLCALIRPGESQFIPLLPGSSAFSAFAITPAAWDRIGLFSEDFYPAYFEDLDYRDRLREDPAIAWIDDPELQAAMQAQPANTVSSATITSDARLAKANQRSFQVNRLWYLSRRRLKGTPRGQWLRRWLCSWPDSPSP